MIIRTFFHANDVAVSLSCLRCMFMQCTIPPAVQSRCTEYTIKRKRVLSFNMSRRYCPTSTHSTSSAKEGTHASSLRGQRRQSGVQALFDVSLYLLLQLPGDYQAKISFAQDLPRKLLRRRSTFTVSLLSPIQITQAQEWCTLATFLSAGAKLVLRLSVALFLLDLLRSNTKRRRILYFILSFIVTMNVASIALFPVQCHSNHQFWSIHPPSACFSPQHSKAIVICLDERKDQTILSVMIKLMLQIVGSILCNSSLICLTIVILLDAEKSLPNKIGIILLVSLHRFIVSYPVLRKKIYSEAVDCSFIACVTVQTVPLGKDTGLAETRRSRAWLKGVSSS